MRSRLGEFGSENMKIKELQLEEGESVFIILYNDEGRAVHAKTVFVLDGEIQLS